MSSSIRGGNKDIRPLVKAIRAEGFELVASGNELVIVDRDGRIRGQIRRSVHDHRALHNLRAELRRSGVLPKPKKPKERRRGPAPAAVREKPPPAPALPVERHDEFDWLRRPCDRERSAVLRQRLLEALAPLGGPTSANRRVFAAAALRLARHRGLRSFSSEQPQYAAERALWHLLERQGSLAIWTLRLFGETLAAFETRRGRQLEQAA